MAKSKRSRRQRNRPYGPKRAPQRMLVVDSYEELKMPRPLSVPQDRRYRFTLRNAFEGATTAGGNLNTYISADPSSTTTASFGSITQFNDWANLALYFNEVRLVQFEVAMAAAAIDDTKGDTYPALAYASNRNAVLAAPTTYQQVANNGDSRIWPMFSDKSGKVKTIRFCPLRPLTWASTATPNPGSSTGIYAGCPGSVLLFATGWPVSVNVINVQVIGTYELRCRI